MNKSYLLFALDNGEYQLLELDTVNIAADNIPIIVDRLDKESIQAVVFMLKAVNHHKELENKQRTHA